MRLLLSFPPDEDIIMELRTIITILATVQVIENGSRDTQNEVGIIALTISIVIISYAYIFKPLLPQDSGNY